MFIIQTLKQWQQCLFWFLLYNSIFTANTHTSVMINLHEKKGKAVLNVCKKPKNNNISRLFPLREKLQDFVPGLLL